MERTSKSEFIKSLKRIGYIRSCISPSLYVDKTGKCMNVNTGNTVIADARGNIRFNDRVYSLGKVLASSFNNVPYRTGQIEFINGNKKDFRIENLKYKALYSRDTPKATITDENMITAIRCYHSIEKRFTIKDTFTTKFYLKSIAVQRQYFEHHANKENISVFKSYLIDDLLPCDQAKKHNLTVNDCKIITKQYLKSFIDEIVLEHIRGYHTLKPYIEVKRKISPQKAYEEFQEHVKERLKKL